MGLAPGILGVLLWIVASVLAALASVGEEEFDPFANPYSGC